MERTTITVHLSKGNNAENSIKDFYDCLPHLRLDQIELSQKEHSLRLFITSVKDLFFRILNSVVNLSLYPKGREKGVFALKSGNQDRLIGLGSYWPDVRRLNRYLNVFRWL